MSAYLMQQKQNNLDAYHLAYKYLSDMISRIEFDLIYKLNNYNLNYATQTSIPYFWRIQFLFSVIIHKFNPPAIIHSLSGNYIAEYRYHTKILKYVKPYLKDQTFKDLESVFIKGYPSLY